MNENSELNFSLIVKQLFYGLFFKHLTLAQNIKFSYDVNVFATLVMDNKNQPHCLCNHFRQFQTSAVLLSLLFFEINDSHSIQIQKCVEIF